MNRKANEQLLDIIGDADERYLQEYLDEQKKARRPGSLRKRLVLPLAAALLLLFGTVSLAAIPAIGSFLENFRSEQRAVMRNLEEIEAKYAVRIDDTQECDGVIATLNSAVLEDHYLLLNYTFNWSGLEEAADGSFHTYYLPWFFSITEGENIISHSEYTKGLHTSPVYPEDADGDSPEATHIYCIDLENGDGNTLIGKELTVRLLYSQDGPGFVSTFTPKTCFTGKSWDIGKTYDFDGHKITLNRLRESALYLTLFIDCTDIGHNEDEYSFVLSDELGNDYTTYPNEDHDQEGYWFIKPKTLGNRLTLKVIRRGRKPGLYGEISDGSYEVLYEIPVELKTSFRDYLPF